MVETQHFDIAVIGGGAGLAKIASPCSKAGYKVALFERETLGGTCLNRGCIPSKMLIYPASVMRQVQSSDLYEIDIGGNEPKVDFEALVTRVSKTIDDDANSIAPRLAKNPNLTFFHEYVHFVGPKVVENETGTLRVSADKWVIATGSVPNIPAIPGLEGTPYMTSREALRLTRKPKKLITLGGGFIAVELTSYFAAMGVETLNISRSELLRPEDGDIKAAFHRGYTKHCPAVCGTCINSVAYDEAAGEFTVTYRVTATGEEHKATADALLVATGVKPATDKLNLEATGVTTNRAGYVVTDQHMATNVEGMYAIGDVAGHWLLRHSANREGEYLMEKILHPRSPGARGLPVPPIDYHAMPHAVFTHPQVAASGPTEEELKAAEVPYIVGRRPYSGSAYGMAMRSGTDEFVKLIFHRETREVLAFHIIGHEASVLAHEVLPVMRRHGTMDDLLDVIHIHPALSELVRNAAREARDQLVAEVGADQFPLELLWR